MHLARPDTRARFASLAAAIALVVACPAHSDVQQAITSIPTFVKAADILGREGPKEERSKAVPMLEAVARRGDARAQVMLGAVYLLGELVPRDLVTGYAWLQIGSLSGDGPFDASTRSKATELMRKTEPYLSGGEMIRADQITHKFMDEREQRIQGGLAEAARFYVGEAPTKADLEAFARDPVQVRHGLTPTAGDRFVLGCAMDPSASGCGDALKMLPPGHCSGSIPRSQAPPLDRRDPDVRVRRPFYPAAARRAGIEGDTRVVAHVDSTGWVCSVRLGVSSGIDILDDASLEAVRQWRLKPSLRDGTPVDSLRVLQLTFALEGYEFDK